MNKIIMFSFILQEFADILIDANVALLIIRNCEELKTVLQDAENVLIRLDQW